VARVGHDGEKVDLEPRRKLNALEDILDGLGLFTPLRNGRNIQWRPRNLEILQLLHGALRISPRGKGQPNENA